MMKPTGWKRIGIIVSVAWILGAGVYVFNRVHHSLIEVANVEELACEDNGGAVADCDEQSTDYLAGHKFDAPIAASSAALIPVFLGWGLVYLVLFAIRRTKRGSASASF